jgi:hypothetical protein
MTEILHAPAPSYSADSPLAYLLELADQAGGAPTEEEQRDDAETTAAHHIYNAYAYSLAQILDAMSFRAITLRQPWAACMVHGDKRIENRPRPWQPGWRLLHAGADIDRSALRHPLVARTIHGHELHTRAIIGVARITGCHNGDCAGSSGYQKLRNARVAAGGAPASPWTACVRSPKPGARCERRIRMTIKAALA